jgi:hypothetical protein
LSFGHFLTHGEVFTGDDEDSTPPEPSVTGNVPFLEGSGGQLTMRAVVSKRGVDDGNQKGGGFLQPAQESQYHYSTKKVKVKQKDD